MLNFMLRNLKIHPKLQFLKKCNLTITQERKEYLITLIKYLYRKQFLGLSGFLGKFFQIFREEIAILLKNLLWNRNKRTHYSHPFFFFFQNEANISFRPKLKRVLQEWNHRPISLLNMNAKTVNKSTNCIHGM